MTFADARAEFDRITARTPDEIEAVGVIKHIAEAVDAYAEAERLWALHQIRRSYRRGFIRGAVAALAVVAFVEVVLFLILR